MCNLVKGGLNIFVPHLVPLLPTAGTFGRCCCVTDGWLQGRMLTENVAVNVDVDFFKARLLRALEASGGPAMGSSAVTCGIKVPLARFPWRMGVDMMFLELILTQDI